MLPMAALATAVDLNQSQCCLDPDRLNVQALFDLREAGSPAIPHGGRDKLRVTGLKIAGLGWSDRGKERTIRLEAEAAIRELERNRSPT
jgi:hypothetical protein